MTERKRSQPGWPLGRAPATPGPDRREGDVTAHLCARRTLLARGDVDLAHGASVLAAVAALRIAASRSSTAFAHEVRVRRLRSALSGFDEAQREHLAALMEAALAREAEERLLAGLAPHGGRLRGWLGDVSGGAGDPAPTHTAWAPGARVLSPSALARYAEAAAAVDVDVALSSAVAIVEDIVDRARRGDAVEAGFDALERTVLPLCVRPATGRAERDDARRTLVILALTLRRRRPLVAVMVRRRLALDRQRWGGGLEVGDPRLA